MEASFEKIQPGDSYTLQKHISAEMIDAFAASSGDYNPVHMDDAYGKNSGFKSRIAHGALILSFLSELIGMHLPGKGSVWLSQNMDFISPAYAGDSLAITATVIEKTQGRALSLNMVKIKILIKNQIGRIIVRGQVKVAVKNEREDRKDV